MRVFISYSFIDRELHLLTLLVSKLQEKGNVVILSEGNFFSQNNIIQSDIFIGIITNNSNSVNAVIQEWNIAERQNKQRILLVEKGVNVIRNDIEFIVFDRYNPQSAISQLFQESNNAKGNTVDELVKAGAIIAGIAALISLFSKNDDKNDVKK